MAIIPEAYKIADEIRKSPKGLSIAIERDASKKGPRPPQAKLAEHKEISTGEV